MQYFGWLCPLFGEIRRHRVFPVELSGGGQQVQIEIPGEMRDARMIAEPWFDPEAGRMRGQGEIVSISLCNSRGR